MTLTSDCFFGDFAHWVLLKLLILCYLYRNTERFVSISGNRYPCGSWFIEIVFPRAAPIIVYQ